MSDPLTEAVARRLWTEHERVGFNDPDYDAPWPPMIDGRDDPEERLLWLSQARLVLGWMREAATRAELLANPRREDPNGMGIGDIVDAAAERVILSNEREGQ